MLRAPASRRLVGTGVAVAAAAGIGFGAYSLGSASDPTTPQGSPVALQATASPLPAAAKAAPATPPPAAPTTTPTTTTAPLTLEQAKAVAARAASLPGRVVEWDADQEPTGLRYDVTLLHADGTTTDVEVDTVTGKVTSIEHDDHRD